MDNCIRNKAWILFPVCSLLLIAYGYMYMAFPSYRISFFSTTKAQTTTSRINLFRPISTHGIFTLSNVCLELLPAPFTASVHQISFVVTQRIVIYDKTQKHIGPQRIGISGPNGHPWNYYDVHFTNESLTGRNRTIADQVAYFVSSRCPGNFHHFVEEEYIPLYSVVRLSNMLFPGADNVVMYPTPYTDHNTFCRNYRSYNEIVKTLYTNGFHDVYYNVPKNTCFRKAVFGSRKILNDSRDVVDHVIRSYNLSEICSRDKANYFTIISRKRRRIINMDDLFKWILESGFRKQFVRIVDFKNLSIREQMITVCTSRAMIGVNGAALQWGMFMPEGSHVVEMAWPSRSWRYFYTSILRAYRLNYHPVELKDIRFNFTSYEFRIRNGGKVGSEERKQMMKSPSNDLWKWSDAFLHHEELKKTLATIFKAISNETSEFKTFAHKMHN